MKPKGTIYQHGKTPKKGEVILVVPFIMKFLYNLLRGVGAGLVAVVVLLIVFLYGPIVKEEARYAAQNVTGKNAELEIQKITTSEDPLIVNTQAEEVDELQKEAESHDVGTHFSVVIPKIGAASDIVANVDPWNAQEYERVLKNNVAHAKGTYFPGQGSNVYLFSHSTDSAVDVARYNAVFYLLRKLETNDKIIVFFSDKKYVYEVEKKVVVDPKDIGWITDESEEEILILQTCDPPGTTWNRLLVIAKPAN